MRQQKPSSSNSWDHDEKVVVLWSTMYGLDGSNGVNGTVKGHGLRLSIVEAWQAQFNLIARLVWWLALGLMSLSGFLLSDPAARLLAKVIAP